MKRSWIPDLTRVCENCFDCRAQRIFRLNNCYLKPKQNVKNVQLMSFLQFLRFKIFAYSGVNRSTPFFYVHTSPSRYLSLLVSLFLFHIYLSICIWIQFSVHFLSSFWQFNCIKLSRSWEKTSLKFLAKQFIRNFTFCWDAWGGVQW